MDTTGGSDEIPIEVPGSEVTNPVDAETATRAIQKSSSRGPRSAIGKQRSKYNALKHGLFAKVVLLSHESRARFDALLLGLQHDLKPIGLLEEALVEKLATSLWRYRRLLQAESAELLGNMEERRAENAERSNRNFDVEARRQEYKAQTETEGLIPKISNPEVLESCIDELATVKSEMNKFGFGDGRPDIGLGLVYGARYAGRPGHDLFDCFVECLNASRATDAERQKKGFCSEDDCVNKFIAALEEEIRRLESLRKYPLPKRKRHRVKDDLEPTGMQLLKSMIPDSSGLDRLLRYEVSMERALDRTLTQLERVRRIHDDQRTIDMAKQARMTE